MKKFPTLAVVSAATGWKVTDSLDDVLEVMSYVMNRKLHMKEMTLAFSTVNIALTQMYPWMDALEFLFDDKVNQRKCEIIVKRYGAELEVPQLGSTPRIGKIVRR